MGTKAMTRVHGGNRFNATVKYQACLEMTMILVSAEDRTLEDRTQEVTATNK